MIFDDAFAACVALQKGEELTAMIDGHRVVALELQDRFVVVMDGTLLREGSAYDAAVGFVRTTKSLDRGAKYPLSKQTSHTRLTALKDVPIVEEPKRRRR